MFDQYSMASLQVIAISRVEASLGGSAAIRAEHLLLGLLRVDPTLLQRVGCTLSVEQVRLQVSPTKVAGGRLAISSHIPVGQDATDVFRYAAEAARDHNSRLVRTEHLLLGLTMVEGSSAATLLRDSDVSLVESEEAVSRLEANQDQEGNAQWVQDYPRLFEE